MPSTKLPTAFNTIQYFCHKGIAKDQGNVIVASISFKVDIVTFHSKFEVLDQFDDHAI